ncbi:phage gp6-like head-tail connector protein [Komagataeibacter europaeus]|uniref:Phage gp6-like head-tail connector protein n=1 Tax=Komagataeibacter europaeus TaxID=33995 RepID=A0A0M0EBW1_KOMEU|nr:head-tail connector protein [Komagataeibacter europaeus]KON62730.1 phage gp6-like head-tail connector protein [Komagataeibacter europaeus]
MAMISVSEAKTQLRLEPEFTAHDSHLESLIKAAQRSIERGYCCTLVSTQEELEKLPDGVRGFIADEDIQLAMKMMVARWYLDPVGANTESDTPAKLGVEFLLFPLMEHTV